MSNIAIKVEGIGKRYDLHRKGAGTLRDTLANAWKQGFGSLSNRESFWALKDVSFEVPHGQVLGIIGRNGAGKSTLLKILSRITPPTKGRVEIDGRVASLLEVGTGFHPELTGRENIFLNGAILGMSRAEIRRKFDEIVDFSGVERFLDTPVKHYSSGMYVRLAFAVAAHLEAEILLIDEVLAVGDVEFQRKCLGKMGELAEGGRTVLMVSHNLDSVKRLCTNVLQVHNGAILSKGVPNKIISQFIESFEDIDKPYLYPEHYEIFNENLLIRKISYLLGKIIFEVEAKKKFREIAFVCSIKNQYDTTIFKSSTAPIWSTETYDIHGKKTIELELNNLKLISGIYFLGIEITYPEIKSILKIDRAYKFSLESSSIYKGNKNLLSNIDGFLMVEHNWIIKSS